jgi:hypothetical protein
MNKLLYYIFIGLLLSSCGKRCALEPTEKEDIKYPRMYPAQNNTTDE